MDDVQEVEHDRAVAGDVDEEDCAYSHINLLGSSKGE